MRFSDGPKGLLRRVGVRLDRIECAIVAQEEAEASRVDNEAHGFSSQVLHRRCEDRLCFVVDEPAC
jgi:hypothetical protein